MSELPKQLPWGQASNQWPATLNPVIKNPLINGQQINLIVLAANTPKVVSHSLGQAPRGWFPVDNVASCTVFRTQPYNVKNITLEASADTTISIWIY